MSEEIAISVQGVSKAYRIWESPAGRLTSPIFQKAAGLFPAGSSLAQSLENRAAKNYRDFWALKDISFEVKKGESVGIIGRNGSGKSTILQIIAGTLQPTSGTVKVNGRVAALLELGSGFNPEFTGRENVYLNAAVLGLSRTEVDAKFESIAAFADIGDFIEQPVKTYSSGMMVRLAFAVQTAVEPEVLIIDEALSVGDAPFQAKCFARIRHLQGRGCTILLVTHDSGTIQTFCQKALWLAGSISQRQGISADVCGAYNRDCARAMGMDHQEHLAPSTAAPGLPKHSSNNWINEDRTEFEKNARIRRRGTAQVQITNFFVLGEKGSRTACMRWDEDITAVYVLNSAKGYSGQFRVGLSCVTLQGTELLSCADRTHRHRLDIPAGGSVVVTMPFRLPLKSGDYSLYAGLFLFSDDAFFPEGTLDFSRSTVADSISYAAFVTILPQFNLGIHGPVHFDTQISVIAS
ncbi:ABC transporter ATP-binding protein [Nibricoccus aquaticus]|uniref:ABC transporter ATP-binding protein n=1 Tax=Nibricoccus aquaticus TaxID=2576891 RepID=A0A290QHD2_9BACT|nr:ABC transporter ATP-binding protein [Nibricoccus aquaticus]ATC64748.1 ABC transporter ATP-binding protein [Nibricoccus aquaticus]